MPDPIRREHWQEVSECGTPSQRYQLAIQRFSFCRQGDPGTIQEMEDELHRCRYVWQLWNYFSYTRLWRESGPTFACELDWVNGHRGLFRYILKTLRLYAIHLYPLDGSNTPLLERTKHSVVRPVVEELYTKLDDTTWLHRLGMIGNPYTQSNGREVVVSLRDHIQKYTVAEVRAGIVYALFAKLRYGRLKTVKKTSGHAAKPGSRLDSKRTELSPFQSVLHQQWLRETKVDRNNALHKVSHERYLMESDLPDLAAFLHMDERDRALWRPRWVALTLRDLQEQERLDTPSAPPAEHPYPLPDRK
jgi:hypothetical protein